MKISKKTLSIFENMLEVNKDMSMVLIPGKTQRVTDKIAEYFIEAEIEEDIPQQCYMREFEHFVKALKRFKDPDVTFSESSITIKEDKKKTIIPLDDVDRQFQDDDELKALRIIKQGIDQYYDGLTKVSFTLRETDLKFILSSLSNSTSNDVQLTLKDHKVIISSVPNSKSSEFDVEVDVIEEDLGFEINDQIPLTTVSLMKGYDYDVDLYYDYDEEYDQYYTICLMINNPLSPKYMIACNKTQDSQDT